MTYCVAAMLDEGMVFASDSRTNAGVDNVATFKKMSVFEAPGERVIVLLSAGNLAITQAALNVLQRGSNSLMNVNSMYEAAELVGSALRDVRQREAPYLSNVDTHSTFILGGQIMGEPARLFMVYSEGNFIEATDSTTYFQIGEMKYGKPIIDRMVAPGTSLDDAVKCVLVSFDSTMRSNLTVGLPIDLLCYEKDQFAVSKKRHIDDNDAYMHVLRDEWNEGVRQAFARLPNLNWGQ